MIPILFESTETKFESNGIGSLSDAVSCVVVEERNGIFELTLEYPESGIHFSEILDRRIVFAIPSPYRDPQPFRIYRITRPMDGIITVYAQHISYDLSGVPLNPFTAMNAPDAMSKLSVNAAVNNHFVFWTDKTTVASFSVSVPSSTRSVLGGSQGSILDVYGGEYEWDKYTIKLHGQRGNDNGVLISYGKNLTNIEQDRNISSILTGIYPYWTNTDGDIVTCDPKIINAPGTYNFSRVIPVDFSSDFQEQPTPDELKKRAEKYVKDNNIGVPKTSITASFVQLEQYDEYKNIAILEKCDLCDFVTIQYSDIGIDAKAEIVKIETDVLLERYNSVEIGDAKTNIADTIAGQQQQIDKKPSETYLKSAILSLTSTILGATGGSVRLLDTNGDGDPDTLYIADNPDPSLARKVWRFNYEGWGASENGYNGPFKMGATLKDGLLADFITAGTLNAALVKVINLIADHIVSKSGQYTMELWGAVLSLMENENARIQMYTTKQGGSVLQLFSGNASPETGVLDNDARYGWITPDGVGVGEDINGNYHGNIFCGTAIVNGTVNANGDYTNAANVWHMFGKDGIAILTMNGSERIGHFEKLSIAGGAPQTVKWVWNPDMEQYVLCTVT